MNGNFRKSFVILTLAKRWYDVALEKRCTTNSIQRLIKFQTIKHKKFNEFCEAKRS